MTSEVSEVISILYFRYHGRNRTKLYIECRIHVSEAFYVYWDNQQKHSHHVFYFGPAPKVINIRVK